MARGGHFRPEKYEIDTFQPSAPCFAASDNRSESMYFSFDISALQWLLTGLAPLFSLVALVVFMRRALPVWRRARHCSHSGEPREYEDVAVIVCSKDEASDLEVLLPQILDQDYPARFEVIVVNDGDSPAVRQVVADLALRNRNIYMTGTPDGARSLSRKKLAITLGVKATRMPVVGLTTAAARITSRRWLRGMMRHFVRGGGNTEVVLGYAAPPPYDDRSFGSRARSFDRLADACSWLSPAIAGHPWRGTEHNLFYTRELFFRNKGFSRHLNLRYGDDDIFVSEIADGSNTSVELAPETIVELPGANSRHVFRDNDRRRRFTRRFIRRRPRFLGPLGWLCYMLAPVPAICAALLTPFNWAVWALAAASLAVWFCCALPWRRAAMALDARKLCLSLPLLCAGVPFRRFMSALRALRRRGKRYTWE